MATGAFRPETKTGAGPLRERFAFEKRVEVDDGAGNTVGSWQSQFTAAAARMALRGGEAVQASRLEGKQPYLLTVRYSAASAAVTPSWRCLDTRTGQTYAIITHVPRSRRDYIDMLISEGVADTEG